MSQSFVAIHTTKKLRNVSQYLSFTMVYFEKEFISGFNVERMTKVKDWNSSKFCSKYEPCKYGGAMDKWSNTL